MKLRGFIFCDLAAKIFAGNGTCLARTLLGFPFCYVTRRYKEVLMISRNLLRLASVILLSVAVSISALAQYGGGGTSGSGTGTYTAPSGGYSSGTGIAIGV